MTLADLGKWKGGGTPSKANPSFWTNGSIPWISPKDMKSSIISSAEDYITEEAIAGSATSLIPKNSLLIVTRSGILRHSVPIALNSVPVAINQDLKALTLSNHFDVRFVANYLWARDRDLLFSCAKDGTTVESLDFDALKRFSIALPPLEEQRKIAEILSTWDEAIEQQTRLLELKREHKRGLMQQLLTGKVRFKEFEGLEWETLKLEKLVDAKAITLGRGNVISKTAMDSNPGEYPVYSSSVKKNGLFGAYGEYMFDEELITWSVDGGGNFFYRPKHRFSVTNVCGYMRLDTARFNYRFVAAYLEAQHERLSFDYQSKAHPSVIVKLYDLAIPTIQEQQKIAAVLSTADAELETLQAQLSALRVQKRGLMQQLLTGKTRVKVDAAPADTAVLP